MSKVEDVLNAQHDPLFVKPAKNKKQNIKSDNHNHTAFHYNHLRVQVYNVTVDMIWLSQDRECPLTFHNKIPSWLYRRGQIGHTKEPGISSIIKSINNSDLFISRRNCGNDINKSWLRCQSIFTCSLPLDS